MTIIVRDNVRYCVARGTEYPLGRPFVFTDGCFKYNCECHSDGSWECPGHKAEYTCGQDPFEEDVQSIKSEFLFVYLFSV